MADVPEPGRRYLHHAIASGARIPNSVRLETSFHLKLREEDHQRIHLLGVELLAPPIGFVWRARARVGMLPLGVQDSYFGGTGAVRASLLRLIPVVRAAGPRVSRSARGRLAAEAIWQPSALLPADHVRWEAIDEERARVVLTIDGEPIPVVLAVDASGRLREMSMLRYGDVGVATWQPIPFGIEVQEERTFGDFTIPSRLRGGWWYGTERFDRPGASEFEILAAHIA